MTKDEQVMVVNMDRLPIIHDIEHRLHTAVPGDTVWYLKWNNKHRVYHANCYSLQDIYFSTQTDKYHTLINNRYETWKRLSTAWTANGTYLHRHAIIFPHSQRDIIRALLHPHIVMFHGLL